MPQPELFTGLHNRLPDAIAVFPRAEQFPAGLPDHPMAERPNLASGDLHHIHVKEANVRRRFSGDFLHKPHGVRPLHLEAKRFSLALIHGGAFVAFCRRVVAARFQIVLDPIRRRRSSYEIESILVEIKKNRIAYRKSIVVARHELLGLIHLKICEAVNS